MNGIQFEYRHASERSNPALIDYAVHSLIHIMDSDLKVARISPLNRNGIHNVVNFIRAGGK
jgi:hypothetical protein